MQTTVDRFLDPPPSPMPGLALPFAVAGAAAGWLSAGFIANPIVIWGESGLQAPAAACGAFVFALMGSAIRRWCRPANPFAPMDVSKVKLLLAVMAGGVATGGLTAALMVHYGGALREGLWLGLLFSIPFAPICGFVLDAARRAERARLGSLVAAADRREVWTILLACISVATLIAVPDWSAFAKGQGPAPFVAVGMGLAAGVASAALFAADRRATKALAAATVGMETPSEPGELSLSTATDVPKVDLGLGDELFAKLSRSAAAYRTRDKAVAIVVGSPDQALAALRRASRMNMLGIALATAAVACHAATALQNQAPKAAVLIDQNQR